MRQKWPLTLWIATCELMTCVLGQFNPSNPLNTYGLNGNGGGVPLPQDVNLNNDFGIYNRFNGMLVLYGSENGDQLITDNQHAMPGFTIRLPGHFPFYGAKYNYTMISTNGYISFGTFSDDGGSEFKFGPEDTDWPSVADPPLIAPYICRQRVQPSSANLPHSYVGYRVEMRQQTTSAYSNEKSNRRPCAGKPNYMHCDSISERFLDAMQDALLDAVAGASTFRAESALVVTWKNVLPNIGSQRRFSTFQLVWLTDAQGLMSYSIINYDRLGYNAADVQENDRMGRCRAVFNGGNHTGLVAVDLSEETKKEPASLARRSSAPHVGNGRYLHRVDDVVRPAGCSNKTGGTFPLLIYPNIVNMLGETTVEVNGLCLTLSETYVLMIEQRQMASCQVLNSAIARCRLPKVLDWGTKTVYFQPQNGFTNGEKAYVGYIYFVPPTIDPMRLDIGDLHSWFVNPAPLTATLKWYPRNYTNAERMRTRGDASVYSMQLGVYVVGYKEAQDEEKRKFVPKHRILAKLKTVSNNADERFKWEPQLETLDLKRVEEWYLTKGEQKHDLFTYRFGYLKLSPLVMSQPATSTREAARIESLPEGLISSPISLHWLWSQPAEGEYDGSKDDRDAMADFVREKSREMCKAWFEEDGALDNFIRDTESNSSCPCKAEQARADIGRFMPHPRCSTLFRDVSCTETLGSMNCFMSAQNVQGSEARHAKDGDGERSFNTHYGQTCCYDAAGYLMQSTYQPVLKIDDSTPYSPGFPTRAYEFGTNPFQGIFEVPGLSTFHHDIMPYYLCCKYADFRCQMFYWRRPSSSCQSYEPPVTASVSGAGLITPLVGQNFIFNDPGVYTLLHAHKTASTPEVQIQVRMEQFPDRSVDFSRDMPQAHLVQPTNVTVVTGIVLSAEDTDRVHVLLRKDTRRGRYRTSIIVGNVIRYFDTMHLQRFRGVTVYVNTVERGQADVYVVLDSAQIGVRIRESYAIDVDRISYFESFGLLDLQVSVPPQYYINPHHDIANKKPRLEGLIMPYPDHSYEQQSPNLLWSNINNEGLRTHLMTKYKVNGNGFSSDGGHQHQDVVDLFTSMPESESLFKAFADYYLKGPVYPSASQYRMKNFVAQNELAVQELMKKCGLGNGDQEEMEIPQQSSYRRCPADISALTTKCNNDAACIFDALLLQETRLGTESSTNLHSFIENRGSVMAHYNSCGSMNIEYPEYLIKGPASASPAYLDGDKLSFSCYQTHIIKGDIIDFTCRKILLDERERRDLGLRTGEEEYRMQWTQGGQPWCRPRTLENTLTWMMWTVIIVGIIIALLVVFLVIWSVKQKKVDESRKMKQSPRSARGTPDEMEEMMDLHEKSRDTTKLRNVPSPLESQV